MKNTILLLTILISFNSLASDMSENENWNESHKNLEDGSAQYIGSCTLHQDFENEKFTVGETLVEYFEPRDHMDPKEFAELMKEVEPELIKATESIVLSGSLMDVDDVTVEKISSTKVPGLNLYRLNIGVGGGNGMYLVFNRTLVGKAPSYELLSNIFDGDIEFCDSKVWMK